MFRQGEKQYRECVSCGFSDEMRLHYAGRELDTRVNKSPEEREQEVKPIKLVDP